MSRYNKILIIVDNAARDLLPSRLLQKKLNETGAKAYVCSKRDVVLWFYMIKPDACVFPRGDWPITSELAKSSKIFVMPSEGARLTAETMMSVFVGRLHSLTTDGSNERSDQSGRPIKSFNFIDRVYLWGQTTRSFLKTSGYFSDDQLFVSGNSRLDIYRSVNKKKINREKMVVGFAFSAKSTSVYDGRLNYAEQLFSMSENSFLPMVPKGHHWEDYAWRDFAILRRVMWIIKRVLKQTEHKVLLRIGPFENINDYQFLQDKFPDRLEIQKRDGLLVDFLENIDCLVTCWSTTGIEAQIMGIPTIAIPFLIDEKALYSHVDPKANGFDTFLNCYHTPKSENEVMEMIEQCRHGSLAVYKDKDFYDSFIKDVYHWPSERSASDVIAADIIDRIKGYSFANADLDPDIVSVPVLFRILMKVKVLPQIIVFSFYRLLKLIRNFQIDVTSNSYVSNRAFYHTKDSKMERKIKNITI
jgi:surface carbohydrate biosynthesis protein